MSIWQIKRFINQDKDLTLDELLAAKVVCKGALGTSFEFTDKNNIYPVYSFTLESLDEDVGTIKKRIINIRPSSYSVKVSLPAGSVTVDIDDIKLGEIRDFSYTISQDLGKFTSPGTHNIQVPDGFEEITVTAIAGGAEGGKGANGKYSTDDGGAGGGGGGAGQSVINKTYKVTPGQTIQIVVGNVKQATKIGELVTLQPGVAGTNAIGTTAGKGGTIGGKNGNYNSSDIGGNGGDGGPGINEVGEPVSPAKGGIGSGESVATVGANGTGYGSGGAGGGGGRGHNTQSGAEGGQPTSGFAHIIATINVA